MSARLIPALALVCLVGVWYTGGGWAALLAIGAGAACYMLGEDGSEQ